MVDESDRTGMRAVVRLKKDADANKICALLLKYTDLETTFGINMVAIAGGKPSRWDCWRSSPIISTISAR